MQIGLLQCDPRPFEAMYAAWLPEVEWRAYNAEAAPFVGICFGHQMIGPALGGRVAKNAGGWCIGVPQFTVREQRLWMQPPLDSFGAVMSCQDQVEELPPGATVLAANEHCRPSRRDLH